MPINDDVRALVAMAGERPQSVHAEGHAIQDRLISRRAVEARRPNHGHVRRVPSLHAGVQPNGARDQRWRLWAGSGLFVRSEYTIGKEEVTVVVQGPRWWRYSPTLGAATGAGPLRPVQYLLGPAGVLLEPKSLLEHVEINEANYIEQAGRQGVALRAVPNAVRPRDRLALRSAGTGADEYCIVIDAEHGFLLRVSALFQGEILQDVEVTEITFDDALPPSLFNPESLGTGRASFKTPVRRLSIAEVIKAVDFQIYLPDPAPGNIAPHVSLFEASERGFGPKRVVLTYPVAESGKRGQLRIAQMKTTNAGSRSTKWEKRDGLEVSNEQVGPATRIRVRRRFEGGTTCELESTVISSERLFEVARTLRAVGR